MKKYLISLVAIGIISVPALTTIACGINPKDKSESKYVDGILVSTKTKKLTKDNTTENFANKKATLSETRNKNEVRARIENGQPFALHFHSRDLTDWIPENDPDRYFNKATMKLRDRKFAKKYINTQTTRDLDILASLNESTSYNPIGTLAKKASSAKIFTMWSHISKMIGWGGSAKEGNYIVPKGDDINAAHRNGVPILGTLFMPPNVYGGQIDQYKDMVVKKGSAYPVADSMIKMANYYGFDGWFLNFETTGISNELRKKIRKFINYLYNGMKKANQFLILYDFGEGYQYYGDGNFDMAAIDFQNRDRKSKYIFPNNTNTSIGYNYDVGKTTSKDEGGDFDYSKYPNDNLWIYTYFKNHDTVIDGEKTDLEFFSSSEGKRDPRTIGIDKWIETSKYFQDRTILNSRKKFSTSFEQGFGNDFYVNGKKQKLGSYLSKNGYRNVGIQDILPTYTWINDYYDKKEKLISDPHKGDINIEGIAWKSEIINNELTYYGSSSLKFSGKIEQNHSIESKLYATNINLKVGDNFSLIVRDLNEAKTGLVIWTQDKNDANSMNLKKNILTQSSVSNLGNGFIEISYKIPSKLNNQDMKQFGLKFINDSNLFKTKNFKIKISKLSYTPFELIEKKDIDNQIIDFRHDGDFIFRGSRNLRINWDMKNNEIVDHYRIYSTDENYVKKELLTVTTLPAAYLKDINLKSKFKIIIEALDQGNNIISSTKVEVKTTFEKMSDLSKWSVKWNRPDEKNAKFIFQTNNGYTTSSKIDNELYVGDDYTRIHKISKSGDLLTSKSDYWGKQILGLNDGKNTKILSIFNWDNRYIAALTSKGTLQLINKINGKIESDEVFNKNIINNFINIDNEIESVSFTNVENGTAQIILNPINSSSIFLSIDLKTKKITQNPVKENIKINIVKKNSSGNFIIAYKNIKYPNDESTNIEVINELKLEKLSSMNLAQKKLNDFVLLPKFKNALKNKTNIIPDETEFFAKGKIIDLRIVNNKILAVNSWGLVISMNMNGSNIKVSSIIDGKNLNELISYIKNYDYKNDPAWIQDKNIGGKTSNVIPDGKLSTLYKIWKDLFNYRQGVKISPIQSIIYDSTSNQYIYALISRFKKSWWGHWDFESSFKFVNISNFINNPTPPPTIKSTKSIFLSNDASKKIDYVRFIKKIGTYFIVGGSTGKIALYDKHFKRVAIGEKIYMYNGRVIQILDKIFNDNDYSIPNNLTK